MIEVISWSLVVLVPPIAGVSVILAGAHLWRRHERLVLALGVVLSFATFVTGVFAFGSIGSDDARLVIRNESSWPIEVRAEQPSGTRVVRSGGSAELVVYGGPGWANGLVIEPEIRAGPDYSVVLDLAGLTGEELTIIVTNDDVLNVAGEPR
jgi:hypothetical protein